MIPRARSQHGSGAVELLMLAPVIMAAALLMAYAGRQVSAQMSADATAHAAARAAWLREDSATASAAGERAAAQTLASHGLACIDYDLALTLEDLEPGGTVTATLTCTTSMAGLGVFAAQTTQITGHAAVPIDVYREAP